MNFGRSHDKFDISVVNNSQGKEVIIFFLGMFFVAILGFRCQFIVSVQYTCVLWKGY